MVRACDGDSALVEAIWIFVESDRFSEEFTFGCNAAFFLQSTGIFFLRTLCLIAVTAFFTSSGAVRVMLFWP